MKNHIDYLDTPLGALEIEASAEAVKSILFVDKPQPRNPNAMTNLAKEQLQEYFSGTRTRFTLVTDARGTEFQQAVWQALSTIQYAQTCSYSDIAKVIQNPKAVRAVGAANGRNPLTIVVPCHRVIGSNGTLTGYASGTERKAWLLAHENRVGALGT